jgi:NAD(P)-dependent dehydrogenase (short-subunit alcohol dehydrogenase family)
MTRVALVLGGARRGGMGRAIVERFLEQGCAVVLSDIGAPLGSHPDYDVADESQLAAAVRELGHLGPISSVECDVADEAQVIAAFDAVIERHGRVDVVVNCAGLAVGLVPVTELSLRDWQVNIDVMATGAFLVAREAARRMIEAQILGRIITISSQAGKTGQPLLAAYSAAKFAVIGLTQSLAGELGRHGITVNAVCPGTIDTPLLAVKGGVYEVFSRASGRSEEDYRARLMRHIPAGRFGTVDDIASAVSYLASEEASFVTGEALNVTGGQEVH